MSIDRSERTDVEHLLSILNVGQKSVILIRQTPNQNYTIDISVVNVNDDPDRPDPLRIPEVIIVICVLLLWCGSIIIFIRHSELLRIRHRDLPFRSPPKPPIALNHITIINHTNDTILHSKSGLSSIGGFTPPVDNYAMSGYRHGELSETVSSELTPKSRRCRHTRSLDMNASSSGKYLFDKRNEKEQLLLHPHRISSDIQENLLDLHRKSVDNLYRKTTADLSTIKKSTFHSTNDMSRRKPSDVPHSIARKRCVQESPV